MSEEFHFLGPLSFPVFLYTYVRCVLSFICFQLRSFIVVYDTRFDIGFPVDPKHRFSLLIKTIVNHYFRVLA